MATPEEDLFNSELQNVEELAEADDELTAPRIDAKSFVKERIELLALVDALTNDSNQTYDQTVSTKIKAILEKYQEQSSLLDAHLPLLVGKLMAFVRRFVSSGATNASADPRTLAIFKTVYLVCKVRGAQIVARLFPHEVIDLEPTFGFLCAQKKDEHATWEVRFVALLWLSIIALVPFNLDTIDSQTAEGSGRLQDRLLEVAKAYLADTGLTSTAAASLLATLFCRPDYDSYLDSFLQWSASVLLDANADIYLTTGVYNTLIGIFKRSTRSSLLPRIDTIMPAVLKPAKLSTINRKLSLKLVQKVALTLLAPRNPKWKYQKRSVSLLQNLGVGHTASSVANTDDIDDDEEYDIPDAIEDVIDRLQSGLGDKDTIVRWSAAKGIGRVTNRLPMSLADEVVGTIVDIFNPRETDSSWHGACLAVAELARRGLLLPARLPSILPRVIDALNFEQKRGSHTIGAHVRDAACYVCWALARAYEPQVLEAVLSQGKQSSLAVALITAAVFDKEVNCRRAAAAAFQEHVGRSGASQTFPFGLEIIQVANFFTLSNRTEAFLSIAHQVAQHEPYRQPLIDHLVANKVGHVDMSLRETAARALHNLASLDPGYFIASILPRLLPSCVHPTDVFLRQGAILALSEIVKAIGKLASATKPLDDLLPLFLQKAIREIPGEIDRNRLYRGKGAEWIRIAVCKLIQAVCEAGIPIPRVLAPAAAKPDAAKTRVIKTSLPVKHKPVLQTYIDTLEEDLKHPQDSVQDAAVPALRELHLIILNSETDQTRMNLVNKYVKQATSKEAGPASWRGFTLALGTLPPGFVSAENLSEIVNTLIKLTKIPASAALRDAETRRNAIISLRELVSRFGSNSGDTAVGFSQDQIELLLKTYLQGLDDYSVDNRGDIGSWVREAAIKALAQLMITCAEKYPTCLSQDIIVSVIQKLVKQSVEKIDKMRDAAGRTLQTLLNHIGLEIPRRQEMLESIQVRLQQISQDGNMKVDSMDWSSSKVTFPLIVRWIQFDEYAEAVLSGLVRSVGGKNNSRELLDDSVGALTGYIRTVRGNPDSLTRFGELVLRFWYHFQSTNTSDIQASAFYRTLDVILSTDVFYSQVHAAQFASSLTERLEKEYHKIGRNSKSLDRLSGFAILLASSIPLQGSSRGKITSLLLQMFTNEFPVVRKAASSAFIALLQVYPEVFTQEQLTRSVSLIQSLHWDTSSDFERASTLRDMYFALGVPVPVNPTATHISDAPTLDSTSLQTDTNEDQVFSSQSEPADDIEF